MVVSAAARAQVALEGAISKRAAMNSLAQGNLPQVPPRALRVHGLASRPLANTFQRLGFYTLESQ